MSHYFDGISYGNKVWSIVYGWGEVTVVGLELFTVNFYAGPSTAKYDLEGRTTPEQYRTLFWNEVIFTSPARPKSKVKKIVWINVFKSDLFETEEKAIAKASLCLSDKNYHSTIPIELDVDVYE